MIAQCASVVAAYSLAVRGTVTLCLLLLCGCPAKYAYAPLVARPQTPSPVGVVHDVRVFAATGPTALEHQDVVWRDGRIE